MSGSIQSALAVLREAVKFHPDSDLLAGQLLVYTLDNQAENLAVRENIVSRNIALKPGNYNSVMQAAFSQRNLPLAVWGLREVVKHGLLGHPDLPRTILLFLQTLRSHKQEKLTHSHDIIFEKDHCKTILREAYRSKSAELASWCISHMLDQQTFATSCSRKMMADHICTMYATQQIAGLKAAYQDVVNRSGAESAVDVYLSELMQAALDYRSAPLAAWAFDRCLDRPSLRQDRIGDTLALYIEFLGQTGRSGDIREALAAANAKEGGYDTVRFLAKVATRSMKRPGTH